MENAKIIGLRVIVMSLILIIGAIASKTNVITKDGTKQLSSLELKIVNPLLIFMSYQTAQRQSGDLKALLITFLLSIFSFAITIPLASLIKRKGKESFSVERFSCIYSNCGFMGIPLISALYGAKGVLYLSAYITVFNLLVFTHGYMLIKEETDLSAFKEAVKSPTVIAAILGLLFYIVNFHIPFINGAVGESLEMIVDMNAPIAMLIAGSTAARSKLFSALKDIKILTTAACKLLIMPAAVILLMWALPDSIGIMPKTIVIIASACPAATTGTMFALLFDKNAERCSEIFAVTTVLSMLTLPIVTAAASII